MNAPTIIFIAIIVAVIALIIYGVFKLVSVAISVDDTTVSGVNWFEREQWHKSQGHTKHRELHYGYKQYRTVYRDKDGYDVTYQPMGIGGMFPIINKKT